MPFYIVIYRSHFKTVWFFGPPYRFGSISDESYSKFLLTYFSILDKFRIKSRPKIGFYMFIWHDKVCHYGLCVCDSDALDALGLKRYCCRRMLLSHVDLI